MEYMQWAVSSTSSRIGLAAAVVGAAVLTSYLIFFTEQHQRPADTPPADATASIVYACPMHAHIVQGHPGACPVCGMTLVAAQTPTRDTVFTDAATQFKLGVRVAAATERRLTRQVHTYGTIAVDGSTLSTVSPRYDGWIRKLHVHAVGERVRAGEPLYEFYSPELVARQRDYLDTLTGRATTGTMPTDTAAKDPSVATKPNSAGGERPVNNRNMMLKLTPKQRADKYATQQADARARQGLILDGIDAETLNLIVRRKQVVDVVTVRAPRDGVITDINAREGGFVTAMTNVVGLAGASNVWVDVTLYDDQLRWVKEGDEARVVVDGAEDDELIGRLHLTHLLDPQTRTVRARLTLDGGSGLRPGHYADVTINAAPHKGIAVPRTALLRTGRETLVMRRVDDAHFLPTPVKTGVESAFWVEITQGLAVDEVVAVNGQFLLAAEADLQDTLARHLPIASRAASHEGNTAAAAAAP